MPETSDVVQWRAVVGYEGLYEVSSDGRVRSLDRITPHGRRRKSQVLSLATITGGYQSAELYRNGVGRMRAVSVLAAEAFFGPKPNGFDVCHNDGNPANNALSNLRYDTRASNQADRKIHGTHCIGERSPNARLTWDAVRVIRASDESCELLARRFCVSRKAVWLARKGKTWFPGFAGGAR
jgi:hypothetical protein